MEQRHRRSLTSGFTLIEVLVAVLVLAIGILGLAGLQLTGMRSNYSAYQRTLAVLAVSDLSNRMRMAPEGFADATLTTAAPSGNPTFDRWARALAETLPAPASGQQGAADCASGNACNDGNCEILVRWDDSRAADAEDARGRRQRLSSLAFRACTRLPGRS